MTGNLVMNTKDDPNNGTVYLDGAATRFRTIYLTGNQDFNNLILNGIYYRTGITRGDKNYPSTLDGSNFVLVVIAGTNSNIVKQIFFKYGPTPDIYIRFSSLSQDEIEFGSWEKISKLSDISGSYLPLSGGTMTGKINVQDELNDTFTGLSKGNYVTTINEISDLNDVKSNCVNFYPPNVAISEESKNFPVKISGFLVSIAKDESTYIRQIYFSTPYNNIYTRIYNSTSTSWSNWDKILFETDIVGNYLPLSGGTMTGNITMSNNAELVGNARTSDFFKLIHIPNDSDMNKIIESGFYAISSEGSVSNAPEDISAETNAFSCFVFPWQYPNTTGISQLIFSGDGTTVKGVYLRLTNNPEVGWGNWVRLDNVVSEVKLNRKSGIYYKISENNNIYKLEVWLAKTLNLTAFGYPNTFTSDVLYVNFENISELVNLSKLINGSISYSVGFTTNSNKGSATVNSYINKNDTNITVRLISLIGGEEGSVLVNIPEGNKILDCIIPKS